MDAEYFDKLVHKIIPQEQNILSVVNDIVHKIKQTNEYVCTYVNELQKMQEEIIHNIQKGEMEKSELDQQINEMKTNINEMEKTIAERTSTLRKSDERKKQLLLRRRSALAKLSPKDVQFIDSIEKRYAAFKYLTGIRWDYSLTKSDGSLVRGYIRNYISQRQKFFEGNMMNPDSIWKKIEENSKVETKTNHTSLIMTFR